MSESATLWDAVIIGGGPAGLTAALNLARARRSVLVLDSNRPRNSATFHAHGYLTRDGVSPLELRRLGREELESYPQVTFERATVSVVELVETSPPRFRVDAHEARAVIIATGLRELLPPLPSLRTWYGTNIHSCFECDAYEYADRAIGLLGATDDLAERALLLSQWSRDLVVFTGGADVVTAGEEARLASRGVRVERREVSDVSGDRDGLRGVTLEGGDVVPLNGLFVRPGYEAMLDYAASLDLQRDEAGLLRVDTGGRASLPGVYAVGDITPPGPQQLIIAAGQGAVVAATVNRDLLD